MLISFFITLGFCQFATGRQEQYKIFNGKIRQEKFTTTNYCVGSVSYARMLLLALFDIKHCNVLIYIIFWRNQFYFKRTFQIDIIYNLLAKRQIEIFTCPLCLW